MNNKKNQSQIIIFLMVFVLLTAGFTAKTVLSGSLSVYDKDGLSVKYPEKWVQMQKEGTVFYAADLFSSGQLSSGIAIRKIQVNEIGKDLKTLSDIALAWAMSQQKELMLYSPLNNLNANLGGKEAMVLDYAFIPKSEGNAASEAVPTVARARDILVKQGESLIIFTLAVRNEDYEDNKKLFEDITESIQVR